MSSLLRPVLVAFSLALAACSSTSSSFLVTPQVFWNQSKTLAAIIAIRLINFGFLAVADFLFAIAAKVNNYLKFSKGVRIFITHSHFKFKINYLFI